MKKYTHFLILTLLALLATGCHGAAKKPLAHSMAGETSQAVRAQEAGFAVSSRAVRSHYADQVAADSPFAAENGFAQSQPVVQTAPPVTPQVPYVAPNSPPAPLSAPTQVAPYSPPTSYPHQAPAVPQVEPPQTAAANPWDFVGTPENTPQLTASTWDVPSAGGEQLTGSTSGWSEIAALSGNGVSIEEAAARDEAARERTRLIELAKQSRSNDPTKKSYLDPLGEWSGPFAKRHQRDDTSPTLVASTDTTSYVEPYQPTTPEGDVELFEWEKEDPKKFDWDVLDPVNFFKNVRDWAGMGPDEAKANALAVQGREILLTNPDLTDPKKCADAASKFEQAAKRWPDSLLAEEALFLAAECRFFADDYPKAMTNYQTLVSKYHHSKWVNTSVRRLFAIARYWERESLKTHSPVNLTDKSRPITDTFGNAKKAYEAIFINDPNGPISDDAVMALASAYLARGLKQGDSAFSQAAYYYAYLRENFPNSRHIPKATEMELLARINAYNGGDYDGKSLDEASSLASSAMRNREGDSNVQELGAIKDSVTDKQAERDWVMAQYYEKKRFYGASRMYYNKILQNYPQTPYASKARDRIAAIASKPDEPPGYLDQMKKMVTFGKK
ncbi:MAG: tetratricopeptide repeat protein [Thermoguttaceae bacterium]